MRLALAAALALQPAAAMAEDGWTLVWSDEFDGDRIDRAKWGFDNDCWGGGNDEHQCYTKSARNAGIEDGKLVITARHERVTGPALPPHLRRTSATPEAEATRDFSSARLTTRGKASWLFGRIEVRAKLPQGQGTWPAIWMLGIGGVWPDDGEIDIMEHTGSQPTRVLGTVHTAAQLNNGSFTTVPTACTAFHDYQLLWTADEIAIGVDGVVYFRFRNPRTDRRAWPFDAPQYLILNIAIGGTLGGAVDDRIFPVTMEVDHVRVWQRSP